LFTSILRLFYQIYARLSRMLYTSRYSDLNTKHIPIRQLIRLSLAVGLLAAFLAPGPAQAQRPTGSSTGSGQGVWQTFTTANSGLRDNRVTTLLEDRAGGLWVGKSSSMEVFDRFLKLQHKEQTDSELASQLTS